MSEYETTVILVVILALFAFGGMFYILLRGYINKEDPIQVLESTVEFADEVLRDSAVHDWLDMQVKDGKLSSGLANMVDVILGVARATSPETESTARKKLRELLEDMTDGDPET